jgi:hypothetical protein
MKPEKDWNAKILTKLFTVTSKQDLTAHQLTRANKPPETKVSEQIFKF